jgi:outer membrane biosynthesis protein TonB
LPDTAIEVPERVVRLMMKPRPQVPREQPRTQPKPKPVEQKLAKQTPPQQVVPDKQVTEEVAETPKEPVDQGILAFREQFANLKQDQVVERLGSQAHIDNASDGATRVERKMLTTNAPGSSGGINLGTLSRGIGGGDRTNGMARTQLARVTSQIGGIGKPGQDRPLSGDSVSQSRTDEEIQIVFDRHKAALYRLYNRELRKDPTLRGQMVLHLTIEPDGSVSMCQLHASDMNAPELAAQVVARVKTIDFGAKDGIPAITILYPIDFLPAA